MTSIESMLRRDDRRRNGRSPSRQLAHSKGEPRAWFDPSLLAHLDDGTRLIMLPAARRGLLSVKATTSRRGGDVIEGYRPPDTFRA